MVIPELVEEIGLEPAIILQQLHWLLRDPRNGKVIDGKRWLFNTYAEWREQHFPWMSERTLMRHFCYLEKIKAITSCQPEGVVSRRKYYRLLVGDTTK
jgi:hypothetical protein